MSSHLFYEYAQQMFAASEEESVPHLHSHLPEHLYVSDDGPKNPWYNLFMEDFILVAEFSEHEGPRPLFTIPEDAGEVFDKNAFAVHVMSVDYQTQTHGSFSLVEDTQLIFSEDRENIYAYVHHFILYDIEARGFVRPFCMCYISNSKKKILSNLDHFMDEFNVISKQFKAVNNPIFHDDLKQRLEDLVYVKDCLEGVEHENSEWIEFPKNAVKNFHGLNKETVQFMITETIKSIGVLGMNKQEVDDGICQNGNEDCAVAEHEILGDIVDCNGDNQGESQKLPGETVDDLEESTCVHPSKEDQAHDEAVERLLRERKRHLLPFRDLHELCGYRAVEGLASLQKLHKHFYQPVEVFSVVDEETSLLEPFSSVLTIGGSFVMNFRSNIAFSATECFPCPTLTVDDDPSLGNSSDSSQSALSAESFKSCVDESQPNEAVCPEKNNLVYTPFHKVTSQDLLGDSEALSSTVELADTVTTASIKYACSSSGHSRQSLEDVYEEHDESSSKTSNSPLNSTHLGPPLAIGTLDPRRHRSSTGDLDWLRNKPTPPFHRQLSAAETRSSLMKAMRGNDPASNPRSDIIRTDVVPFSMDVKQLQLGSTPQYGVIYKDVGASSETNGNFFAHGDGFQRMYMQCYAQQFNRRQSDGPGGGIVAVLKNYGSLVHLLYAFLSGRTVVVLAEPKHQRDIHSLITSLWLFVPGHFRGSQQVVLWRTKPLRLKALSRLKLVGLAKSKQFNVLPHSVETHVTSLDFESGCLKTPPYQGEFLNTMLANRRHWKSDSVFLAYIHSIFLEMSLKAFVCYYATSLGASSDHGRSTCKGKVLFQRDFSMEHATDILDALGILGSDTRIILYLIDLIAEQQIMSVASSPRLTSDNVSLDNLSLNSTTSGYSGSSIDVTKTRPIRMDFSRRLVYKKISD